MKRNVQIGRREKVYGRLTTLRGQKVAKQRDWLTVSDAIGRPHEGGQTGTKIFHY